jgi:hypothetical protein
MRRGVQNLASAYEKDDKHPVVLNHLANHYFINKARACSVFLLLSRLLRPHAAGSVGG